MKRKLLTLAVAALCLALLVPDALAASASSKWRLSQPSKPTKTVAAPSLIGQSAMEREVIRQVNAERAKKGLSQLSVSAALTRAARVRAAEIVQKFSHTRPDGSAWSTVSAAAYGENIARGQRTVDKVMAAWMSSQGHRTNILRPGFGSIGVCAVQSNGVMYWVQLFGK